MDRAPGRREYWIDCFPILPEDVDRVVVNDFICVSFDFSPSTKFILWIVSTTALVFSGQWKWNLLYL